MNALASVIVGRLVQRLRERQHLGDRRGGARSGGRSLLDAIERIHHEHGIARFGEPPAHLAERRPQSKDIRPDEHAWRRAAHRVDEVAVSRAVRRRHGDLRLGHVDRIHDLRQQQHHARSQQDAELPARHQSLELVFPPILLKTILVAHIHSFSHLIARLIRPPRGDMRFSCHVTRGLRTRVRQAIGCQRTARR